jgi:hypothetical protein
MVKYETISLIAVDTDEASRELKNFACPKNPSVEHFIRENALNSSLQGTSQTHMVVIIGETETKIIGFFALANKVITVGRDSVTKTMFKKILKFGYYDSQTDSATVSIPLIAQLGKNFNKDYDKLISGSELLRIACRKVAEAQDIIGGRAVYLECEAIPKLTDFYINNGFIPFGSRAPGDGDNGDLIQFIRFQR